MYLLGCIWPVYHQRGDFIDSHDHVYGTLLNDDVVNHC